MRIFSVFICLTAFLSLACQRAQLDTKKLSHKQDIWVFVMAGQSNMAGRGMVKKDDQRGNKRIITIDSMNSWIIAREPLHFYEPVRMGLDCGLSFSKAMLKNVPKNVTIAILPCAIGGSSTHQWVTDALYRNVKLMSNFREKINLGKEIGTIKGILWHQGESDSNSSDIENYQNNLTTIFSIFREIAGDLELPIILGELGPFYTVNRDRIMWDSVNTIMHQYAAADPNCDIIRTGDLNHKGDTLHFNAASLRTMGERYAASYAQLINIH